MTGHPGLLDWPFSKVRFVAVDTETTGVNPRKDRILEVAAVRLDPDGTVRPLVNTLVNPGLKIGNSATRVHGIDDSTVVGAPSFKMIAKQLGSALAGAVLIAHNARFDVACLRAEFARCANVDFDPPYVCTLAMSRAYDATPELAYEETPRKHLRAVCAARGVRLRNAHAALDDACGAARLWHSYTTQLSAEGKFCLRQIGINDSACRESWHKWPFDEVALRHLDASGTPMPRLPSPDSLDAVIRAIKARQDPDGELDLAGRRELLRWLQQGIARHTQPDRPPAVAAIYGLTVQNALNAALEDDAGNAIDQAKACRTSLDLNDGQMRMVHGSVFSQFYLIPWIQNDGEIDDEERCKIGRCMRALSQLGWAPGD